MAPSILSVSRLRRLLRIKVKMGCYGDDIAPLIQSSQYTRVTVCPLEDLLHSHTLDPAGQHPNLKREGGFSVEDPKSRFSCIQTNTKAQLNNSSGSGLVPNVAPFVNKT